MHNLASPKSSPSESPQWRTARRLVYLFLPLLSLAILSTIARESLWLDELHTAWTLSAPLDGVAERAQAGNQSPLYFWFLSFFSQTLGAFTTTFQVPPLSIETHLRLPSMLAWWCSLIIFSLVLRSEAKRHSISGWFPLVLLLWPILDQIEWFYATEARPYAVVQLLSLSGWCCLIALFLPSHARSDQSASRLPSARLPSTRVLAVAWSACAILSVYIHATASLSVFSQWITGLALILIGTKSCEASHSRRYLAALWLGSSCGVALASLTALQTIAPVWQRRAQWASFANDVSLWSVLTLFPLLPMLVPVLCARSIDGMFSPASRPWLARPTLIWWAAFLGPWVAAWAITALGIAPVFHRRFVIASAWPLMIVAAYELMQIRSSRLRWGAALAVLLALTYSQGTLDQWRQGRAVGWLRVEDWRGAVRWLQSEVQDDEPLFVAAGLIEANQLAPPLSPALNDYLAFPLTGPYHIQASANVHPLVNDVRHWHQQILTQAISVVDEVTSPASGLTFDASSTTAKGQRTEESTRVLWLVYRGSASRLDSKLRQLEADLRLAGWQLQLLDQQRFGAIHVCQLKCR